MVVGAAFDRATAVKLENGTLIVETASGSWARELKRSEPIILPRLQAMLGEQHLTRIVVRAT
jgi:predicted nucleic acid-binding Zn ribbon protein